MPGFEYNNNGIETEEKEQNTSRIERQEKIRSDLLNAGMYEQFHDLLMRHESFHDFSNNEILDVLRKIGINVDDLTPQEQQEDVNFCKAFIDIRLRQELEQRANARTQGALSADLSFNKKEFEKNIVENSGRIDMNQYLQTQRAQIEVDKLYKEHVENNKDIFIQEIIERVNNKNETYEKIEDVLRAYKEESIKAIKADPTWMSFLSSDEFDERLKPIIEKMKGKKKEESEKEKLDEYTQKFNEAKTWVANLPFVNKWAVEGLENYEKASTNTKLKDKIIFMDFYLNNRNKFQTQVNEYIQVYAKLRDLPRELYLKHAGSVHAINNPCMEGIKAGYSDIEKYIRQIKEVYEVIYNEHQENEKKKELEEKKKSQSEEKEEMLDISFDQLTKNLPYDQRGAIFEYYSNLSLEKKVLCIKQLEITCPEEEKALEDIHLQKKEIMNELSLIADISFSKEIQRKMINFENKYENERKKWESIYMASNYSESLAELLSVDIADKKKKLENTEEKDKEEQDKEKEKQEKEGKTLKPEKQKKQETMEKEKEGDKKESTIKNNLKEKDLSQEIQYMYGYKDLPYEHRDALEKNIRNITKTVSPETKEKLVFSLKDFITLEASFVKKNTVLLQDINKHLQKHPNKEIQQELSQKALLYKENQRKWDYDYLAVAYNSDLVDILERLKNDSTEKKEKIIEVQLTEEKKEKEENKKEQLKENLNDLIKKYTNILPDEHLKTIEREMLKSKFNIDKKQSYLHVLEDFCNNQASFIQKNKKLITDIYVECDDLTDKEKLQIEKEIYGYEKEYDKNTYLWDYKFLAEEMNTALENLLEKIPMMKKEKVSPEIEETQEEKEESAEEKVPENKNVLKRVQELAKKYKLPDEHRKTLENYFIDPQYAEGKQAYLESDTFKKFLEIEKQEIEKNVQMLYFIKNHDFYDSVKTDLSYWTKQYENNQKDWKSMDLALWYGDKLSQLAIRLEQLKKEEEQKKDEAIDTREIEDIQKDDILKDIQKHIKGFPQEHRQTFMNHFEALDTKEVLSYWNHGGLQQFITQEILFIDQNNQLEYDIKNHTAYDASVLQELESLGKTYRDNQSRWESKNLAEWYNMSLHEILSQLDTIEEEKMNEEIIEVQLVEEEKEGKEEKKEEKKEEIQIEEEEIPMEKKKQDAEKLLYSIKEEFKDMSDADGMRLQMVLLEGLLLEDKPSVEDLEEVMNVLNEEVIAYRREKLTDDTEEGEETETEENLLDLLAQKHIHIPAIILRECDEEKLEIFYLMLLECENVSDILKRNVVRLRNEKEDMNNWFSIFFEDEDLRAEFLSNKGKFSNEKWNMFKKELSYQVDVNIDSYLYPSKEEPIEDKELVEKDNTQQEVEGDIQEETTEEELQEENNEIIIEESEEVETLPDQPEDEIGKLKTEAKQLIIQSESVLTHEEGDISNMADIMKFMHLLISQEDIDTDVLKTQMDILKKELENHKQEEIQEEEKKEQEKEEEEEVKIEEEENEKEEKKKEGEVLNKQVSLEEKKNEMTINIQSIENIYPNVTEEMLQDEKILNVMNEVKEYISYSQYMSEQDNVDIELLEQINKTLLEKKNILSENLSSWDSEEEKETSEQQIQEEKVPEGQSTLELEEKSDEDMEEGYINGEKLRNKSIELINTAQEFLNESNEEYEELELYLDHARDIMELNLMDEELEAVIENLEKLLREYKGIEVDDLDMIEKEEIVAIEAKDEVKEVQEEIPVEEVIIEEPIEEIIEEVKNEEIITEEGVEVEKIEEDINVELKHLINKYKEEKATEEEIQRKIIRIIQDETEEKELFNKLKQLLSGVPSESVNILLKNIVAQYFGNEKIMSMIMEIHHNNKYTTVKHVIDILQSIAHEYEVACSYEISDKILNKSVYFEIDIIKLFTSIVRKKNIQEIHIEASHSSDEVRLYFMYEDQGMEMQSYALVPYRESIIGL